MAHSTRFGSVTAVGGGLIYASWNKFALCAAMGKEFR